MEEYCISDKIDDGYLVKSHLNIREELLIMEVFLFKYHGMNMCFLKSYFKMLLLRIPWLIHCGIFFSIFNEKNEVTIIFTFLNFLLEKEKSKYYFIEE